MIQTRNDSVMAIWTAGYLNYPDTRDEQDRDVIILQVEHAADDSYIVEFYRRVFKLPRYS